MVRNWQPGGSPRHRAPIARKAGGTCLVFGLLLAFGAVSCSSDSAPVPESQYAQRIVGEWQGTVGEVKETITFDADGRFVAQVRPLGFISNTLGQGTTGIIRGTWTIKGNAINLQITSAKNEQSLNKTAVSTILSFTQTQFVIKSASGETSTFLKVVKL
jgi:hypothetical protein